MNIISQFANVEETTRRLTENSELSKLTHEFCRVFNLRAKEGGDTGGWGIEVLTPEGFPIGFLRTSREYSPRANQNVLEYQYYSTNFINKERRGGRGKNVRASTKISSLVAASKKSDATPNADNMFKLVFKRGMSYAFSNVEGGRSTPSLSIDNDTALKLVESHLGIDTFSIVSIADLIKEKYNKYLIQKQKIGDSKADAARFNHGVTMIGIGVANMSSASTYYLVGEVGKVNGDLNIQVPLKRYESLTELPELMGTVAIIREFMRGQPNPVTSNELGIPLIDKFFVDLDISVGHFDSSFLWVAIPKEGK